MIKKKILTIANQKGGVAKSSTCAQAGSYLALSGKRVLLVDLDAQCSLSAKFLSMRTNMGGDHTYSPPPHPDDPQGRAFTSAALYTDDEWDAYPTNTPGLFILPASSSLFNLAQFPKNASNNLLDWMKTPELWERFDIVIFDTPPAKNLFSESAIQAATHVLIPCPMEKSPFEGLLAVMQFISIVNDPLPQEDSATIIGILPTLYRGQSALHKSFRKKLKSNPILSRFATPFEIRWRPTYQEIEMLTIEKPYEIRNNKKNEGAYVEWKALGDYIIKQMDL